MNEKDIYDKLNKIFQTVFDDDSIVVNCSTNSSDIADWDSLEHINLLVAVEKSFGIKFDMSEVIDMNNVGDMVKIILLKLNK